MAATEEVAEHVAGVIMEGIMADTLTATVMAITATTEDMDMVGGAILTGVVGGAILTDGVILTGGIIGGATPTGGVIFPIHTPTLITALITMVVMGNRRCLLKGLTLRRSRDNSNHLIGISARTQRVTTLTLKIARVVGWQWCLPNQMHLHHRH